MSMRIDILTIFPEMFAPVLEASIIGRAVQAELVDIHVTDIRRYTTDKHHRVDDRPFGGGPGMVMMCQPIYDAVLDIERSDPRPATRILLTPQGRPLRQPLVEELTSHERLVLIAGHYEGIDERVIEELNPIQVSLGDFVLTGGELPAMVLVDAVVRLIPGALGDAESAAMDSFSLRDEADKPLLDCPHYTRPRAWRGRVVPDVLTGGDHKAIDAWRTEQRRQRTRNRRPDLLDSVHTSPIQAF